MAEPAFKIPLGSLILPAALFISSACVLFLTIQSASLATLRSENERESSRQAELAGSLKALRGQLEPAKLELANTAAELARLSEEQKSARDLISRASALSRSVEQFTAEESAAIRRLEETRKLQKESADRVDAARGELAAVGAQIRQLDANRREAETKLSDVTAKETAAAQRLQDRERTVAARERTLAEKERLVAEKDAEAASLSASVKRLDAEKRQLDTDIAARRSEAASLTQQLAGLDRDKVAVSEAQRVRAEFADLSARLGNTRQEVRNAEAALVEKEAARRELERVIGELNTRKSAAEVSIAEAQRLRAEAADLSARLGGLLKEVRNAEAALAEKEASRRELERVISELNARKSGADTSRKSP